MYGRRSTSYKRGSRSKGTYKKRYKKYYKSSKKIPAGFGYNTLVNKSNGVMPAKYITRHTYNAPVIYPVSGSAVTQQIYRGNSLYDPDQTGVGTTASGYNLMTTIYSYYRVYASAIEFTVTNTGDIPCIFYAVPTRTASALTLTSAKSYPYYKEVIVGEQSGGNSIKKLKVYCVTSVIMDVNSRDFDLQGAAGSNPLQQWYWICGALSIDGLSTGSVVVSPVVTYYTEWNSLRAAAT